DSRRLQARNSFDAFLADNAQRDAILNSPLPAIDSLDVHLPLLGSDPKSIDGIIQGQKHPSYLPPTEPLHPDT
ncbi:MAG: hypothetical protein ACKO9Q_04805, partial [Pirellula sp.]